MGFSNYFIFYFIRRFLNLFFNKKRLKKFAFIIIVAVIILFILHNKGYCVDWSYTDSGNLSSCKSYLQSIYSSVSSTNTYLNSISTYTYNTQSYLNTTNSNLTTITNKLDLLYSQDTLALNELNDIESYLATIDTSTDLIYDEVSALTSDISQLRAIIEAQLPQITTVLNTINGTIQTESNETQEILSDGFSDIQELLTQYMFGSDYDKQTYDLSNYSNKYIIPSGFGSFTYSSNNLNYMANKYYELPTSTSKVFNFKLSIAQTGSGTNNRPVRVGFSNSLFNDGGTGIVTYAPTFTGNTLTYSFNSNTYNGYKYLIITTYTSVDNITLTGDYNAVMEKGQTQAIMDNQSENAEMIDNTITDSSVTAPFGELPTDSTQDITESGFTNIFDTIRTTFTSGVARDLVVPIPFTGKNFTINTANVYGNINLGMVGTLITAFWYFAFSLFIAKDIANKINMIKSGNLENIQSTNIKEDLL